MVKRVVQIGVGVIVVVLLAGVALWYFVLREDAPNEVSTGCKTGAAAANTDLSGNWQVQPGGATQGDALLQDNAPGPYAGYRIDEDLRAVHVTAVGRTPGVTGQVTVDASSVTAAHLDVDMTTLHSPESRRDSSMTSEGLETKTFPTSTFELSQPIALDQALGCQVVNATGNLTLHGQTRPVTIPLTVVSDGNGFLVTGSTQLILADFGISKLTIGPATIDPVGKLELNLPLQKA